SLCADKTALAHAWYSAGVNTPALLRFDATKYPLVCKPRYGAGSQATFRVGHAEELKRCLAHANREISNDELILQEYVDGLAVSVSFLIGSSQTLPLLAGRQILSSDGRFRYLGGMLPLPEPLQQRAVELGQRAIACVPGLRGFVGVDLVLGENADWAI